jgi:D-alanyl-D-alanine carboxypeptidase
VRTSLLAVTVAVLTIGLVLLAANNRAQGLSAFAPAASQGSEPSRLAASQPAVGAGLASPRQPAIAAAASGPALNERLSRTIEWQFGGKTQRGWYLYLPLIQRIIGLDADPGTEEFSRAVARWQKSCDFAPADGSLTEACWVAMMQSLQQARTRDAVHCPPGELVQISAEQWFDPERPPEQRYLRRDAYEAYLRMVAEARAELGSASNGYFAIISGHRSPEYQAKLRALAGGNPSTASLARNSPHFTGRAIDIYVGGEPVSTVDSNRAIQVVTPAYKWLARNAHRFGFRPYFYEPWHWEYDPRLVARN